MNINVSSKMKLSVCAGTFSFKFGFSWAYGGYGGRYDDPGPNRRKRMDSRRTDPYGKVCVMCVLGLLRLLFDLQSPCLPCVLCLYVSL